MLQQGLFTQDAVRGEVASNNERVSTMVYRGGVIETKAAG